MKHLTLNRLIRTSKKPTHRPSVGANIKRRFIPSVTEKCKGKGMEEKRMCPRLGTYLVLRKNALGRNSSVMDKKTLIFVNKVGKVVYLFYAIEKREFHVSLIILHHVLPTKQLSGNLCVDMCQNRTEIRYTGTR